MSGSRYLAMKAVLECLALGGVHRLVAPMTRGLGVILTMHHVRPAEPKGFDPNGILSVTPQFLDAALTRIRRAGFDIVTLDGALERLADGHARPFVVLTFDDGYRDVRDHALPVLARHGAPYTLFITSDFAEGRGELWWLTLEDAIAAGPSVTATVEGRETTLPTTTDAERQAAWDTIYWSLRGLPEPELRAAVRSIAARQGVDAEGHAARLCLRWAELAEIARDPLCTIGAHTVSHPRLATLDAEAARREMAASREAIRANLGLEARHLAYPVGDLGSAGPRDHAIAAELGFASAVTTRPGHLFAGHLDHRHALPRVSLNGAFQVPRYVDVFLSGAPFALLNRGRKIAA